MSDNVLLVLADDMRFDFLPFAQGIVTRVSRGGRKFAMARCNVGLCQPFRVGLLTGKRAHHHGVYGNGDPTGTIDINNTLAKWLDDVGYRTGLIGKYLNGVTERIPKPTGWDTWLQIIDEEDTTLAGYNLYGYSVCNGGATIQPASAQITYLRDQAETFVAGSEPWFLLLTPTSPHYPFSALPTDVGLYADCQWPIVLEDDVSDKPTWIQALNAPSEVQRIAQREIARGLAREIVALDAAITHILSTLSTAVLARTIVIFASDNGLALGEHRNPYASASKNDLYEISLRVPLCISGPGFTTGISSELVGAEVDIAATIVAATGATAPWALDGVDLRDIQNNPGTYVSRQLVHERHGGGSNNPNPYSGEGISTPTGQKLMRWHDTVTPATVYEMYHVNTDPNEFVNLANLGGAYLTERNALEVAMDTLIV